MTRRNDQGIAKSDLPYRPCVGIMLINKQGRVFVVAGPGPAAEESGG